jgi:hypothetical protein
MFVDTDGRGGGSVRRARVLPRHSRAIANVFTAVKPDGAVVTMPSLGLPVPVLAGPAL